MQRLCVFSGREDAFSAVAGSRVSLAALNLKRSNRDVRLCTVDHSLREVSNGNTLDFSIPQASLLWLLADTWPGMRDKHEHVSCG